jgi:hypothetical protein
MERDEATIRTFVVVSLSFRMCGELLRKKVARLWQSPWPHDLILTRRASAHAAAMASLE